MLFRSERVWEREKKLSVVSIALIGIAVRCNYRAQRSGIEGERKRPQYRALRDTSFKRARFGQGAVPCHLIGAVCQVGCEPGKSRFSDAKFGKSGKKDLVVHRVKCWMDVDGIKSCFFEERLYSGSLERRWNNA